MREPIKCAHCEKEIPKLVDWGLSAHGKTYCKECTAFYHEAKRNKRGWLQFHFFSVPQLKRLRAVVALDLLPADLASDLRIEFWVEILDRMDGCDRCIDQLSEQLGLPKYKQGE